MQVSAFCCLGVACCFSVMSELPLAQQEAYFCSDGLPAGGSLIVSALTVAFSASRQAVDYVRTIHECMLYRAPYWITKILCRRTCSSLYQSSATQPHADEGFQISKGEKKPNSCEDVILQQLRI